MARTRTVSPPAGTALDVITGLPLRAAAEAALADAGRKGTRAYACIIVLDRLATLNQRFGRDVGDEIMIKFVGAVKQSLGPEDRIFRWGGTAFLALLPRSDSIENVRKDVVRTVTMRLEHMIQTESRSIMLPIAARWTLFPMMGAAASVQEDR